MNIDLFVSDYYRLLKLLNDNQTTVLGKKVIPLTQSDICEVMKWSKMKVNSMFVELQKQGYLIQETRGKYALTDESESIVKVIEQLGEK